MTTTETPEPITATELTLAQRTAADLRVLADLAATHPQIAEQLAETVRELFVVLPRCADLTPADIAAPAVDAGGIEAEPSADHRHFATRSVDFPNGVLRLTGLKLTETSLAPLPDVELDAGE